MTVYIVTKEGVYRHETVGVYLDKDAALLRAIEAIEAECDDYHEYRVAEYEVGIPITDDGECLYFVSRSDEGLSVFVWKQR